MYIMHTLRSPSRYQADGRVSGDTMSRRDSNYTPARTLYTRDRCSSCKRNSAFRVASAAAVSRSPDVARMLRTDEALQSASTPIDTRIIRS